MVQMAAAFSSVINGGSYYEPHVVRQIVNEQGAEMCIRDRDGSYSEDGTVSAAVTGPDGTLKITNLPWPTVVFWD